MGKIPVEDLGVLILDSFAITLTSELMVLLAKENVVVIWCDERHMPVAVQCAQSGHHVHAKVLRNQINVAEPTKKRLWQCLIQAKVRNQAEAVRRAEVPNAVRFSKRLASLVPLVRSGDPDNIEAQCARAYWPMLFGPDFLRARDEPGVNACLNYGYAVARAACARALVGTGLAPALGIHHRNIYNPFALADDVMEPLRPMVDLHVFEMLRDHHSSEDFASDLTPPIKRKLLEILLIKLDLEGKSTGFMIGIPQYAAYFKQALCREKTNLIAPGFSTGVVTE